MQCARPILVLPFLVLLFFGSGGIGSSALGQSTLVAEGMITPKNATTASEVVIVQMRTASQVPGPPIVVSADPPRLALSTLAGPTPHALVEPMSQSVGRLAAGSWEVYSYGMDWGKSRAKPEFEGFSGPASFHVTRGEVHPKSLHPVAGEPFVLAIDGPWSTACVPGSEELSIEYQPPRVLVLLRRPEVACPPKEPPVPFHVEVPIAPLPAGLYEVEVRVPELEPDRIEVYAAASFRVVPRDEPRILKLRLEHDLERQAQRLVAVVEIPKIASGGECFSWDVRPRNSWAHGRNLYAQFEMEPRNTGCGEGVTTTYRLPLPDLETGLYRILAQRMTSPGVSELWAQSPTLVESQKFGRLIGGRYLVTVTWRDHHGRRGRGVPVTSALASQGDGTRSAIFSFFSEDNWELLVKVLNGCALNGHYWVFASASTDVAYTLKVEDLISGAQATYHNELGQASPAITDTTALLTCETDHAK